ncbi:MAG: GNAT family N-acetyltransferase [Lentimicrobium sp.]|nr:GNAT family N-acetyltransferase [Lentimicrobium sp.]
MSSETGCYLRDYLHSDYEEVNNFWNENGLGGKHRGDDAEVIEQTLINGGHLLLLCNETGKIIGTSWLTNDKRRTYLHHFGIDLQYRGRGLSKMLLSASLIKAKKDGYQIKIEVHHQNEVALRLYKTSGFKPLGEYDVFIIRDLSEIPNF